MPVQYPVVLKEITRDNWRQCARLKVAEGQQNYVATNINSLAMAIYEPDLQPRAIYDSNGDMVGFIMYGWWEDQGAWWIARVMVDKRHQGRGYGKAAIQQVIDMVEREHPDKELGLSYLPTNESARALYLSLGFIETGETFGHEVVARKPPKEKAL